MISIVIVVKSLVHGYLFMINTNLLRPTFLLSVQRESALRLGFVYPTVKIHRFTDPLVLSIQ